MPTDSEVLDYIDERLKDSKEARAEYARIGEYSEEEEIEEAICGVLEHILIKFGRTIEEIGGEK